MIANRFQTQLLYVTDFFEVQTNLSDVPTVGDRRVCTKLEWHGKT